MPPSARFAGCLLLGASLAAVCASGAAKMVPTILFAAMVTGLWTRTRFRRLLDAKRSRWMDALPLTPLTRYLHHRRQAMAPAVGLATGAALLAPFEPVDAAALAGAILAVALVSLAVPVRKSASFPASRYRLRRPDPAARVSLRPLSTDLSVAIAARLQPKTLARSVVPFLLVAPSGMAPLEALMMGLAIAAGLYVHSLSSALMDCAENARRWSASLPIDSKILPRHWRRAARVRVAVSAAFLALPLLHALPLALALLGLCSMFLWVEMRSTRVFGL